MPKGTASLKSSECCSSFHKLILETNTIFVVYFFIFFNVFSVKDFVTDKTHLTNYVTK